jgi:hypothetical protein
MAPVTRSVSHFVAFKIGYDFAVTGAIEAKSRETGFSSTWELAEKPVDDNPTFRELAAWQFESIFNTGALL